MRDPQILLEIGGLVIFLRRRWCYSSCDTFLLAAGSRFWRVFPRLLTLDFPDYGGHVELGIGQ